MNRVVARVGQVLMISIILAASLSHVFGSGQTYVHADVLLFITIAALTGVAVLEVEATSK